MACKPSWVVKEMAKSEFSVLVEKEERPLGKNA